MRNVERPGDALKMRHPNAHHTHHGTTQQQWQNFQPKWPAYNKKMMMMSEVDSSPSFVVLPPSPSTSLRNNHHVSPPSSNEALDNDVDFPPRRHHLRQPDICQVRDTSLRDKNL